MLKSKRNTIRGALGREPVHPFPARMAPGIALDVLSEIKACRVLDPMMGSGTVLAMARAQGHRATGFDIDPLALIISKAWIMAFDSNEVREQGLFVLEQAVAEFKHLSEREAYPNNADDETRDFVRYWFDVYARRQLAALAVAINRLGPGTPQDVLWCAFSRLVITKQAGASLAMDLSHSRPHRTFKTAPEKPFNSFASAIERVLANGIDRNQRDRGPKPTMQLGDARELALSNGSVDLVLTSPPYLNAIDYMRCSKFSLVWMGYQVGALRQVRAASIGSESTQRLGQNDEEIARIIKALKLRPKLGMRNERILATYILDMKKAISEVSRVLARGGKAVYVVGENTLRGTFIRTSVIISELADSAGLSLIGRRMRSLPANRRYMPPPSSGNVGGAIGARMRRELVLTFEK
jgi:hypothetical protein